ncbi:hypothetical protein L873DRAFT_1819692 [Choiromyces venosus 120613-1]|uniref:Uncharacterized protein n=1 Tax=Choiromyces venosus 120613-1 TaxID=1336337 RepID=A0A3N4J4H8_9PEZI|nr:hypothetical protein L873DRAFT_1819692 [Choiromyces venosus 120613-1]
MRFVAGGECVRGFGYLSPVVYLVSHIVIPETVVAFEFSIFEISFLAVTSFKSAAGVWRFGDSPALKSSEIFYQLAHFHTKLGQAPGLLALGSSENPERWLGFSG